MSSNEVNPENGLNVGLDPASGGLPGGDISNLNRDLFGQPLSKAPPTLGNISNPLLRSENEHLDTGLSQDEAVADAQTKVNPGAFTSVYGDEFETGIPPIDYAAHLIGKAYSRIDDAVEASTSVVGSAINSTTTRTSAGIRDAIDTARSHWNAPNNEFRNTLNSRVGQALGFVKHLAADLSATSSVKELTDVATSIGSNLAEKTESVLQTTQRVTEAWVDKLYSETYLVNAPTDSDRGAANTIGYTNSSNSLGDQLFIGVIDTGFGAQEHGAQVVDAIQRVNHQTPNWLGDGVGTGHWADLLVRFVDASKASGEEHAIANLSFDLTQINPDGSVTTRSELTAAERAALTYAYANDVLIVASSGNQGGAMSALGQASQEFDNIITAGAADGTNRANYSSYGEGLDLLAPGRINGSTLTGTSLAAAQVTGTVAEIWATNPQLSRRQVIESLESTTKDLNIPGWDPVTGFGLLNPSAAASLAEKIAPEPQVLSSSQLLQYVDQADQTEQHVGSQLDWPDELLNGELTWSSLDGATPSERPNRVIEGTGSQPVHAPASPTTPSAGEPSPYQGMSADAAEHWIEADASQPSPYQGMSPDAAEHWIEADQTSPDLTALPVPALLKYEEGASLAYDPAVAQWQQRMKDRGYDITVDGLYGSQSKQIASQFQQEQGLAVDGIVGPDTWNATFSTGASESSPLQPVSIAAIDHLTEAAAPSSPAPAEPSPQYEPHDLPRNPDAAEIWLAHPDQKDELLERRANIFADAVEQSQPPISPDGSSHREMGVTLHELTAPPPLDPRDIPLGILRAEGLTRNDLIADPSPASAEPSPQYEPHDLPRNPDAAEIWLADPISKRELLEQRSMTFADPTIKPQDVPRNPDAAEIWLAHPNEKAELLERRANIFADVVEQSQPSITEMSHVDRMSAAFNQSLPMLEDEFEATLRELGSLDNLMQTAVEVLILASPLGLARKIYNLVGNFSTAAEVSGQLYDFYTTTRDAKTVEDLEPAAELMAAAVASVGIDIVMGTLLGGGVERVTSPRTATGSQTDPLSSPDSNSSPTNTDRADNLTNTVGSVTTTERSIDQDTDNSSSSTSWHSAIDGFSGRAGLDDRNRTSLYRLEATSNLSTSTPKSGDGTVEPLRSPESVASSGTPTPRSDTAAIAPSREPEVTANANFQHLNAPVLREPIATTNLDQVVQPDLFDNGSYPLGDSDQHPLTVPNSQLGHEASRIEPGDHPPSPGSIDDPTTVGSSGASSPSSFSINEPTPGQTRPRTDARSLLQPSNATPEEVATLQRVLDQNPQRANESPQASSEEILDNVRHYRDREAAGQSSSVYSTRPDLSNPSTSVRIPYGSTEEQRRQPGIAHGGENLPDVTTDPWFPDGRVGQIPGQIARRMQGVHFDNFRQFRETFWRMVAQDPHLSQGWTEKNLDLMQQGLAPFAPGAEQTGGRANAVYQMDHSHDLQHGGGVYDLDSIRIVTPRFHHEYGRDWRDP